MNVIQRFKAPTPHYWKQVRNIAGIIGAIGATVLTLPISLPAIVITGAGYAVAVGTVVATISQTAKK